MALKDLVAGKSAFAEAAIESIVRNYVRYDLDEKEVHFTAAGAHLPNKAKLLVYLVALQGWSYVSTEQVDTVARPGQMEITLHIPGGSLRPTIKDLKDRHIITERGGAYFVRPAALEAVKAEIQGGQTMTPSRRPGKHSRRARRDTEKDAPESDVNHPRQTRTRPSAKRTGRGSTVAKASPGRRYSLQGRIVTWLNSGFFDQPRGLADVHERFHKEAVIIPQTTISPILVRLVRQGVLQREKGNVNEKSVWVYSKK